MIEVQGPIESRRERKKRAARAGIAATARRLFAERGFDAVTVAEIATAADVSEKTVFNHFPTKEDLAFPGRRAELERLLAAIAQRPPGTSVLDVFRAATAEMLGEVGGGDGGELAGIVGGSRTLRARLATGWEDEHAALTAAIRGAAGAAERDVRPAIAARTLSLTHRTMLAEALDRLRAGEPPGRVTAALRRTAGEAYDQLAGGLGGYGAEPEA